MLWDFALEKTQTMTDDEPMSTREKTEIAKKYVDEQLKVLEQHGKSQNKITAAQYNEMVAKVAKVITCK